MASQALEQMLENTFVPNIAQNRMYQTIDTYTGGTTQLYSFDPPKPLGLQNPQPFQYGYSLGDGYKLDFHGPDYNTLTHGHVKDAFGNVVREYNGYECAMLDLIVGNNFKKFP